jgi:hypothetical protein
MEKHLEQRIRERAYEIWESEGRSGNPKDHWSRAEQELNNAGAPQGQDAAGTQTPDYTIINELGDLALVLVRSLLGAETCLEIRLFRAHPSTEALNVRAGSFGL